MYVHMCRSACMHVFESLSLPRSAFIEEASMVSLIPMCARMCT
jgi:hypothetical protein